MEIIRYSIFEPCSPENAPDSWYNSHNNGGDLDNTFTGNVGSIWALLTATDGTGGFINGVLIKGAVRLSNGVQVDSYTIHPKYNFASLVASVMQGATSDPVSGTILN